MQDSQETSQAEGEGPDGSDKPPHDVSLARLPKSRRNSFLNKFNLSKPSSNTPRGDAKPTARPTAPRSPSSIPLPPPEAGAFPKEPGYTKGELGHLVMQQTTIVPSTGLETPPAESPGESSSDEESWPPSASSTRPPSRANSRVPSVNYGRPTVVPANRSRRPSVSSSKSEERLKTGIVSSALPSRELPSRPSESTLTPTPSRPKPASRPPSVHSEGGHKFQLKDLLAGTPKLHRKSSARSSASSKADSDGDRRSNAGESTVSLSQKYGVCERLAIGKGATSVVRLAHKWDRSDEKLYAVKEFRKRRKAESEKEYVKKLTAEFCISSTLHHVNIVETVDLIQDENKHWCEVMEFCPGGDLYAAIKKGGMSPSEVECCFKQILTGVAYLHSQGVAHRDIKPENLFFNSKGQLKIGDYGASTVYRLPWESTVHMSTGLCGSEPYIAPEQFAGKPYDARLVDIWACGVVYYCLHFQELPWRVAQLSDPLYAAYVQACSSSNPTTAACPPTINNLSPRACRPLIRKMLDPDPKHRWTIEDIVAFPWVQGIEVCHVVEKASHVHVYARALAEAQARESS
ncbi:hypothetical protein ACEPAI_999 [Sanghuangporus weigelae]